MGLTTRLTQLLLRHGGPLGGSAPSLAADAWRHIGASSSLAAAAAVAGGETLLPPQPPSAASSPMHPPPSGPPSHRHVENASQVTSQVADRQLPMQLQHTLPLLPWSFRNVDSGGEALVASRIVKRKQPPSHLHLPWSFRLLHSSCSHGSPPSSSPPPGGRAHQTQHHPHQQHHQPQAQHPHPHPHQQHEQPSVPSANTGGQHQQQQQQAPLDADSFPCNIDIVAPTLVVLQRGKPPQV